MKYTDKTMKALKILKGYAKTWEHGCSPLHFAEQMWEDSPYLKKRDRKIKMMAGSYVARLEKMGLAEKKFLRGDHYVEYFITNKGLQALINQS